MVELNEFLRQDATYAKLEKEGSEMSALAMEALKGVGTEGDGGKTADVAANQERINELNAKLTANGQQIELAKKALTVKYNEAVEQEKGMVATNGLNAGGDPLRQAKTPLDYLMASKEYESIPDYFDANSGEKIVGMKKWNSSEARNARNLSVTVPASKIHPGAILRSNG